MRGDRLAQPLRVSLGVVQHFGRGVLRAGTEKSDPTLWRAIDLQHRPGLSVYLLGFYRGAARPRHKDIDGRQRTLSGQRLRRATLAFGEIRGSLPQGLPQRPRGRMQSRALLSLLQRAPPAQQPRRTNALRGLS